MILWKEKLLRFIGYRGRKRDVKSYSDAWEMEEKERERERELFDSGGSGYDDLRVGFEKYDDNMISDGHR